MRTRALLFGLGLVTLMVSACNCGEDPLSPASPGMCEPTFQCASGFEYRQGQCRAARCREDSDCCPGQRCNAGAGFCADQFIACTDDLQCTEVPGQACIDFRGGKYCGYPNRGNALTEAGTQLCLSQADCDEGRSCFGGRCVIFAPCEGGCREGQICDVDSNTCFDAPACQEQCATGQMLVVADPDRSSGPSCCAVECKCETLPPVLPGQIGWHADLDLTDAGAVVSAYDPTYGDLVVAHFDRAGARLRLDYVDGFPLDGAIIASPTGPRGGRNGPGPQVGEYSSIAVDPAGALHVAYYDRTDGDLKYASNAGGTWRTFVVDERGDVGRYTDLVLDGEGRPHIAYMMVEGTVDPDPSKKSGLKLASARTTNPAVPEDWSIQLVDSRPVVEPPCGGSCPSGEACVEEASGPTCLRKVQGCEDCGGDRACIDLGSGPECRATVSLLPVTDLVEGTGLFASLAFTSDDTPLIAYYDKVDGDLRLARGNAAGGFDLETLDGNDAMNPADVGQSVSLAVGAGDLVAATYVDVSSDDLVYLPISPRGPREVVDNGITPPDLRMTGHDASLIFDPSGQPAIAYQDPTHIDLLYARRSGSPAMWSTEVLRGDPPPGRSEGMASGFYASQKRDGATAYISNVDVGFFEGGDLQLSLSVITKGL